MNVIAEVTSKVPANSARLAQEGVYFSELLRSEKGRRVDADVLHANHDSFCWNS